MLGRLDSQLFDRRAKVSWFNKDYGQNQQGEQNPTEAVRGQVAHDEAQMVVLLTY